MTTTNDFDLDIRLGPWPPKEPPPGLTQSDPVSDWLCCTEQCAVA